MLWEFSLALHWITKLFLVKCHLNNIISKIQWAIMMLEKLCLSVWYISIYMWYYTTQQISHKRFVGKANLSRVAASAQARHSSDLRRGQGFYRASCGVDTNRVEISWVWAFYFIGLSLISRGLASTTCTTLDQVNPCSEYFRY